MTLFCRKACLFTPANRIPEDHDPDRIAVSDLARPALPSAQRRQPSNDALQGCLRWWKTDDKRQNGLHGLFKRMNQRYSVAAFDQGMLGNNGTLVATCGVIMVNHIATLVARTSLASMCFAKSRSV